VNYNNQGKLKSQKMSWFVYNVCAVCVKN